MEISSKVTEYIMAPEMESDRLLLTWIYTEGKSASLIKYQDGMVNIWVITGNGQVNLHEAYIQRLEHHGLVKTHFTSRYGSLLLTDLGLEVGAILTVVDELEGEKTS